MAKRIPVHDPEVMPPHPPKEPWEEEVPSWYGGTRRDRFPGVTFEVQPDGPWLLKAVEPFTNATTIVSLRSVSPKADPMNKDEAEELCRWQQRRDPARLWFVTHQRIVAP